MADIGYNDLNEYLKRIKKEPKENLFSPVYLIYGEELLYKTAFDGLISHLIPAEERNLNYEPIDGDQEDIAETIEKVNTFSLLPGKKVVAVINSKIFYSARDTQTLLEKAKEFFDLKDTDKAVKHILDLLGLLDLGYDDISTKEPAESLKLDLNQHGNITWLNTILLHCKDNRFPIPDRRNKAVLLQQAIEKGFPRDNHLIITADMVDKRQSLYRTIHDKGTVINCSVPKGDRRADRMAQDAVLAEQMKTILSKSKKRMNRDAYAALLEMTGFDLRTFSNNLEKLVSYVGERDEIRVDDVEMVLRRTKKDPIYELTNSIAGRNTEKSLFYLNSLLEGNLHPLQILAAIINQIRRLLVVKDFVLSENGEMWQAGISFDRFKKQVLPVIQTFDDTLMDLLKDWRFEVDSINKKKKANKKKSKTDLLIAKNPKNSYPVYLMLQKSENFTKDELVAAIKYLSKADLQLKSTVQDPKLILENVVFSICRMD